MDKFEKAAREWMKGCSNAMDGEPWKCEECTRAYHDHLLRLVQEADAPTVTVLGPGAGTGWNGTPRE